MNVAESMAGQPMGIMTEVALRACDVPSPDPGQEEEIFMGRRVVHPRHRVIGRHTGGTVSAGSLKRRARDAARDKREAEESFRKGWGS